MKRILLTAFTASLALAPLDAAERLNQRPATAPCGEERAVKRGLGRRAIGLPALFEKHFSDAALAVSSIGIPQARCEAPAAPQHRQTRGAAHPDHKTGATTENHVDGM